MLYGFAEVAEDGAEIWSLLAGDFTALTAYSFMIFNLLCAPCFAAMGAIKPRDEQRQVDLDRHRLHVAALPTWSP